MERQLEQKGIRLFLNDVKKQRWAILAVIACLLLLKATTGASCPMVALTGFPCPGCGLTRAGIHLMHGEVQSAFRIHPFIYGVAAYGAVFAINRYLLGRRMGKVLKGSLVLLVAAMCLFYIWRMIRYFPGDPPISYYGYNLLRRTMALFQYFLLK